VLKQNCDALITRERSKSSLMAHQQQVNRTSNGCLSAHKCWALQYDVTIM